MARKRTIKGNTVYTCEECGFAYTDRETAQQYERWCSTHKNCSPEITKNATHQPERDSKPNPPSL
ncbi:MAG: hypothetical protein ACE5Z5_11425 [Candidatus Bathyarchaeia archaeon]